MEPSTFRSWLWRTTQDFDTLSGLQRTLTLYHLMQRKTVPYHTLLARTYQCVREHPGLTLPDSDGGTDEELRLFFEYLDSFVTMKQQGDTRTVPNLPSPQRSSAGPSPRHSLFMGDGAQPSTSQSRPSTSQSRLTASQSRSTRRGPSSMTSFREPVNTAVPSDSDATATQSDDSEMDTTQNSKAPISSRKRKAQSPADTKQPASKKRASQPPSAGEHHSDGAVKIGGVIYPAGALPSSRVPQPSADKDSLDLTGSNAIVSSTTKQGKSSKSSRKSIASAGGLQKIATASSKKEDSANTSMTGSQSFSQQASIKVGSARRFSDVIPNNIIPGMGRINAPGMKPVAAPEVSSKARTRKGAGK